eukprot:16439754-Heterocapsa_arctica.AAC.1
MDLLGIFRTWYEFRASGFESVMALRAWLIDLNDSTMDWVEMAEFIYSWCTGIMAPRRWLLCLGACALFCVGWWNNDADESETSSTMPDSGGDGDRSSELAAAVEPIELMMSQTNAALHDLLK